MLAASVETGRRSPPRGFEKSFKQLYTKKTLVHERENERADRLSDLPEHTRGLPEHTRAPCLGFLSTYVEQRRPELADQHDRVLAGQRREQDYCVFSGAAVVIT